jgi:lipid A 3-O-deacylase
MRRNSFCWQVMLLRNRVLVVSFSTLFVICIPTSVIAKGYFDTRYDNMAFLGGYGQSIPGWGETEERVETIDLVPRYNHVLFKDIGSGWYRGYHSVMVELPVSIVLRPDVSSMVGVNFLAAYTFIGKGQYSPYIFGGGGPVYNFADIPGMGADFNGNYQFGIGVKYKWEPDHDLIFELRYHHISNGGREEPNVPLNSCKALFGITF